MGITPGTFSDGNAITENAVRTELDRVRTWINRGNITADIDSASLSKLHIARPVSFGFPKDAIEGQLQQSMQWNERLNEPCPVPSLKPGWTIEPEGIAIDGITSDTAFLQVLDEDRWRFFGKRVYVRQAGQMEVVCTLFAATTNDNAQADTTNAGLLRLRVRAPDGTVTSMTASQRKLNPTPVQALSRGFNTLRHTSYDLLAELDVVEGAYDVFLEYVRNSASTDLGQVSIAVPTLVIDIFEQ
jgi:hypothetical protein